MTLLWWDDIIRRHIITTRSLRRIGWSPLLVKDGRIFPFCPCLHFSWHNRCKDGFFARCSCLVNFCFLWSRRSLFLSYNLPLSLKLRNFFIFCLIEVFVFNIGVLFNKLLLWTSLCWKEWMLVGENRCKGGLMLLLCPLLFPKNFFLLLSFLCLPYDSLFVGLFRHGSKLR